MQGSVEMIEEDRRNIMMNKNNSQIKLDDDRVEHDELNTAQIDTKGIVSDGIVAGISQ